MTDFSSFGLFSGLLVQLFVNFGFATGFRIVMDLRYSTTCWKTNWRRKWSFVYTSYFGSFD